MQRALVTNRPISKDLASMLPEFQRRGKKEHEAEKLLKEPMAEIFQNLVKCLNDLDSRC